MNIKLENKNLNNNNTNYLLEDIKFTTMKRIESLREEYHKIRNYEYKDYLDEFDALDRASRIENVFNLLGIELNKFER